MFENFTKENLVTIRKIILAALEPVGTHLGITFGLGNISYTNKTFTVTLSAGMGTQEDKEQQEFNLACSKYGFSPSDYGATFSSKGSTFKLIGFKPRATTYPCICVCIDNGADGSRTRFTSDSVKAFLKK